MKKYAMLLHHFKTKSLSALKYLIFIVPSNILQKCNFSYLNFFFFNILLTLNFAKFVYLRSN